MSKLKSRLEIKRIARALRKKRKKTVFTNGCFDILHYGHIKYLEKCKHFGDILIIGLNSDSSVKKIKGKSRPITKQKERAALISALEFVDYVTLFNEKTPEKLIKDIAPNVLAKGGDWEKKDILGADFVNAHNGRVVTIPFVKGYSTTSIIKRIKDG